MVYFNYNLVLQELAWRWADCCLISYRELDCLTDTGREFQILAPEYDKLCLKNSVLALGTI